MIRMRIASRIVLLAAAVVTATSCGDVVRQSRSPVLIVVDSLGGAAGKSTTFGGTLFSDVQTLITTPAPCSVTAPCWRRTP